MSELYKEEIGKRFIQSPFLSQLLLFKHPE